jgi:hypothetical protein
MKHQLDTPTITAYALGELPTAEARLLLMTFHDPIAAAQLQRASASLQASAGKLSDVLKAAAAGNHAVGLSDVQRARLLALTSAPRVDTTTLTTSVKAAPTLAKLEAERRAFDNKPSRMATYLTAGAAAAVIILLSVLSSKRTASNDTTAGTGGAVSGNNGYSEGPISHFKLVPAKEDITQRTKDNPKNLVTPSSVTLPEASIPHGPSLPMPNINQLATELPPPPTAKQIATAPAVNDPAPSAEPIKPDMTKQKDKPKGTGYASPK